MPRLSKNKVLEFLGIAWGIVGFIAIIGIANANALAGITVAGVVSISALVRAWTLKGTDYSRQVWVFVAVVLAIVAATVTRPEGREGFFDLLIFITSFVVGLLYDAFSGDKPNGIFSFNFAFPAIGAFFIFLLLSEALGFR